MGQRLDDAMNTATLLPVASTPSQVPQASAQTLGQSNPISYTAPDPEPLPIQDRLARGFLRSAESLPQVIGQGLYYLGSNFDPHASKEQVETGSNFADRMAQMGLAMTERNQAAIKEAYPEKPDWIENLAGAGPMVGGIALGTLSGVPEATAIAAAIAGGATLTAGAFKSLRDQGESTTKASDLAAIVGVGGGAAMMANVGGFLKAVGGPAKLLAKQFLNGVTSGFVGGATQSYLTGALQMATGVEPFKGVESLKDLIAEAASTGATFAVWGGAFGVHAAMAQHAAVVDGIKKMGFSDAVARQMATKLMSQTMEVATKKAEDLVKMNKDEVRRIQIKKILKNKPIDETGSPRTDALDEPFVPTEPSKAEALTAELEDKVRQLNRLKDDIKDLTEGVGDLEDAQQKAKDRIAEGLETQAENVRTGKPLDTFEIAKLEQARQELASAVKDADKLKEQIESLREQLKPKPVNPIADLHQQIVRIQQGFRAGKTFTLKDAKFVQDEFNRLIDQSDLDLNDKAKFRKNVPLTIENFEKALPTILGRMRQLEERAEQKEWIKQIKKINLDKLPIDVRDILEPVLKQFDFGFPSEAAIMARKATLAHFEKVLGGMEPDMISWEKQPDGSMKPNYSLTPGERQALEDAQKMSIPELLREPNGHERLRNIVDQILTVYHEGVQKGKYYSKLEIRDHEDWVKQALPKLDSAKGKLSAFEKSLDIKNGSWFKKMAAAKNNIMMVELHSDMIFHMLGWDDEMQQLHEGYQNNIELVRQHDEQLESVHPRNDVGDALKGSHDIEVQLGNETRTFKKVTGDQLLKIYAQSFEEGSIEHIENTFKRPGDTIDTARTIMKEMLKQAVELYPDQCKSVIKQFDYFRGPAYEALDAAVVEMTGHHMSKVDFYDPLIGLEERSGMTPEDMQMGVKGMQGRAEVGSGFTIARVKSELAIKNLDYYGDLQKNAIARANYISMAKIIRDMNKKAFDPRIVKAINDSLGPDAVKVVHGLLRELAAGGANHYYEMDRVLSQIRTNFIIAKIGMNLFSALKEPAQLSYAADYVGKAYVQKAVFKFALNPGNLVEHVKTNSLMMKNMYLRQERDMANLINTGGASDLGPVKVRDQVGKLSMFVHLQLDMFNRYVTWIGQEMKMQAEAPAATREEINAACDAAVRWTHPMGGALYLPALFRGNEIQKGITTFHSATNRAFNLLVKNNRDLGEGKQNYLGWAKHLIGLGLIPAAIVASMTLHRKPTARELALEYLNQTSGAEIYSGWITNMMLSGRDAAATVPFTDFLNNAGHAATDKGWQPKVKNALNAVDDLAKTPLSNTFRDAMMVADMAQGNSIAEPHRGFMHDIDEENE